MSPLMRRIAGGLGANAFSQATNVVMQLVSLPMFLSHWDTATYGGWLILSALPSYLYMADAGMVTAAGNQMTMAMGRRDPGHAQSVLHSACAFMLSVCGLIICVALPLALFVPWSAGFTTDQRIALCVMVLSVSVQLLFGLVDAMFRATERYATGMSIATLVQIGAWIGTMVALQIDASYTTVALGGLVVQTVGCLMAALLARRGDHGLRWGVVGATSRQVRALVKPAVSFMAFPLANALSFQGMTLLVGYLLGPAAVAVFNTTRTLARIGVQLTGLFSHAVWPEFARLYGSGGVNAVAPLYRRSALGSGAMAAMVGLVSLAASPWILKLWTHGAIPFQLDLVLAMMAYAIASGAWHVPRVLLMATNQHIDLAKWTLSAAVLSVGLALACIPMFGVAGAAVAMFVAEALIAAQCVRLAHRFVNGPSLMQPSVAT